MKMTGIKILMVSLTAIVLLLGCEQPAGNPVTPNADVDSFTVTFDKNDDLATGTMENLTIESGLSAELTANGFDRIEAVFAGWNTQSDGSGTNYDNSVSYTMGSADVILYAQWTVNQYTVTYDSNGSTGGLVPDSVSYDHNSIVTVAGNTGTLERDQDGISCVLTGWNTQADGNGTDYVPGVDTLTLGAIDITLYAKWTVIGALGPAGGLVFYDYGSIHVDGWRYLEAAPGDQSTGIQWSNNSNETGAQDIGIGFGSSNTDSIIASQGLGSYAARLCYDLSIENNSTTYDDWFLPSYEELEQMYLNLYLLDLGNFLSEFNQYWSSTEEEVPGEGFISALLLFFTDGFLGGAPKDDPLPVRAIRAF